MLDLPCGFDEMGPLSLRPPPVPPIGVLLGLLRSSPLPPLFRAVRFIVFPWRVLAAVPLVPGVGVVSCYVPALGELFSWPFCEPSQASY